MELNTNNRTCQQSMDKVTVLSEFWNKKIQINHHNTIWTCVNNCEKTERINNFKRALGQMEGEFQGNYYDDSDVYKVLEGIAYSLFLNKDAKLEKKADEWIDIISAAQQEDGYLVTYFILETNGEEKWSDMERHEDYCLGHMIEAAIAYKKAVGKDKLLKTAIRFADNFCHNVGMNKKNWVPGHQEIELALVNLFEETGEEKYLEMAKWLLEERGNSHGRGAGIWEKPEFGAKYAQDHLPVRKQYDIKGHAVRAVYMFSAMSEIAKYTDDIEYVGVLERLWESTVLKNMYITGGIGSSQTNEGFTQDYDLPNEIAYCETCASVGMIYWNHRMNLLTGDAKYADIVERELYNGTISGVSMDGKKFFYVNPLYSHGNHHRVEWYGCSCCPTQIARFIPSIGQYVYAKNNQEIYINQYLASETTIKQMSGDISIKQMTDYPRSGVSYIEITSDSQQKQMINLRVPGWCVKYSLWINGEKINTVYEEKGYIKLYEHWGEKTEIKLEFDMPVEMIKSHPYVKENAGKVAVMKGPVVYCAEEVDNKDNFDTIKLGDSMQIEIIRDYFKENIDAIKIDQDGSKEILVPYFYWDNREKGKMAVWFPSK